MRFPILFFLFVTLSTGIAQGQREPALPPLPISPPAHPLPISPPRPLRKSRPRPLRKSPARIREIAESSPSMIEKSVDELEGACPEVAYETLLSDAEAVQASLPAIRYVFLKRGFNSSEAEQATVYGWKQLRVKQLEPTAELSPTELINYVSGFGKLVIESSPTGASIEIDGNPLPDTTYLVKWPTPGTYRLKLSLEGYESVEDNCTVVEGKLMHFQKTLKPLKKDK